MSQSHHAPVTRKVAVFGCNIRPGCIPGGMLHPRRLPPSMVKIRAAASAALRRRGVDAEGYAI